MYHYKVLATGLANNPGIGFVFVKIQGGGLPEPVERAVGSGEMYSAKVMMVHHNRAYDADPWCSKSKRF